jgi:hypothetical protein
LALGEAVGFVLSSGNVHVVELAAVAQMAQEVRPPVVVLALGGVAKVPHAGYGRLVVAKK